MADWFTIEKIDSDTFAISEYKHFEEVHSYLLIGARAALLIDTDLGVANIKKRSGSYFKKTDLNKEAVYLTSESFKFIYKKRAILNG